MPDTWRLALAGVIVVILVVFLYQSSGWRAAEADAQADWAAAAEWADGPAAKKPAKDSFAAGPAGAAGPPLYPQQANAELRAWQNDQIQSAMGIRNDTAGYGAQRQPGPMQAEAEARTRNGQFLSPKRLNEAEQQAWAPTEASEGAAPYDPAAGIYPGADVTQQLGKYQADWNQQLSSLAIDPRTLAQQKQWADEVGPFSQGAMTVDNLDEAVAMSAGPPRVGIMAFRGNAPAQGPCTQQITELGPTDVTQNFGNFQF